MTLNPMDIVKLLSPELILLMTGFAVIIADLVRRRDDDGRTAAIVALVGLVLAFVAVVALIVSGANEVVAFTMSIDLYALFFKASAIIVVALVILASIQFMKGRSRYLGEFYALLVFAALAISVAVSATNLILVYIGIEFLSITSYILAGFLRNNKRSEEAAIKYFLYGASAGAVMLYGMSLLYGATGSTDLVAIGQVFTATGTDLLLGVVAIALLLAGLGFKSSLVPFHQWAPDTYDGAPTPVTAFLSTASKAAGFAIMGRVFITAFPDFIASWTAILGAMAMLTMTIGNLTALKQTSVKRMLAYSSIAQAGYIVLGLVAINPDDTFGGLNGLMIYIFAYLFTNVGAFLVVMALERQNEIYDIKDYSGLFQRSPGLALLMTLFMLSLAGIPPTAGFMGKFFVFAAVVEQQLLVVAAVAAINVVIGAAYYLNVVRYMAFRPVEDETPITLSGGLKSALVITAVMVLVIGIAAQPFITWATESAASVIAGVF